MHVRSVLIITDPATFWQLVIRERSLVLSYFIIRLDVPSTLQEAVDKLRVYG